MYFLLNLVVNGMLTAQMLAGQMAGSGVEPLRTLILIRSMDFAQQNVSFLYSQFCCAVIQRPGNMSITCALQFEMVQFLSLVNLFSF